MQIQPDSALLFIGDSITDCQRCRPVGTDKSGLGNGYVMLANSLLHTAYPDCHIRVLNTGISGNTIVDLEARWEKDVTKLQPDALSIMIGINDVWRQFDTPLDKKRHVAPSLYEETYEKLISRTEVNTLVIMSPYYIEANPADPMRQRMDQYGEIARKVAKNHNALFVDLQSAFDRMLEHLPSQVLAGDRVHPDNTGHMVIASAFLNGINFDWEKLRTE